MRNSRRAVVTAGLLTSSALAQLREVRGGRGGVPGFRTASGKEKTKPLPAVDPIDPRVRELRSRRAPGSFALLPEGAPGGLRVLTGAGDHIPAFPSIADSDLVADVIATEYQPYFFPGITGIYTEFRLCVTGVVWNGGPPAPPLEAGRTSRS